MDRRHFVAGSAAAAAAIVCVVLLAMSAVSFVLKRKDWRDKLAEVEASEGS